ncbi:hypothetical protein VB834_16105 [Limnoraphis robusta Tam1]|uniref:Uncharacterized protein n=1 Tax=Limnoraphis robusta CCNP1315 TaxID=3110306 RepID=A0ABU5U6Z2_9CYAN|nr:hypothetical protein [Limnoraphis robusta]MEA5497449.1 hypothetical protein [Limnoraphis robusta BA-68 BA1]MEA5522820.1 hypothetical protein [Limnoraphis robusta CCNP1315]MEA5540550.1 hypothetical protein [Limnoraphis robusta Tam1]MEA5548998.1 hypothetical protein [Limnoraphis robusta CCNP1324]
MDTLSASLFPVVVSLTVASGAVWISLDSREEIVCVFTTGIALLSLLLALSFTPWFILLLLVAVLLCLKIPAIEQSTR